MTIYLLSAVGVLVTATAAGVILLILATRDVTSGIEADDDDDVDRADPVEYVSPVPPFPINHIGRGGEHDRYPIRPHLRQLWINHLERSWKLPERTR